MWPGSVSVGSRGRGPADTTIFVGKIASSVRAETVEALVRACGELKVRGCATGKVEMRKSGGVRRCVRGGWPFPWCVYSHSLTSLSTRHI